MLGFEAKSKPCVPPSKNQAIFAARAGQALLEWSRAMRASRAASPVARLRNIEPNRVEEGPVPV